MPLLLDQLTSVVGEPGILVGKALAGRSAGIWSGGELKALALVRPNSTAEVSAVLADGTVISSMFDVLKNNTGYDLRQLFVGSEGTLGVVTRAVLRLYEAPLGIETALLAVPSWDVAMPKFIFSC